MFELKSRTEAADAQRLIAPRQLTRADFLEVAKQLGTTPQKARKIGFIAARKSPSEQSIETLWNGKESKNTAQQGDWVITNLAPDKTVLRDRDNNINQYVIAKDKFSTLYERVEGENSHGQYYRAISQVEALYLSAGFEIMTPWGELQRGDKGYLLLNGSDVYGNHKETFDLTYELLD